MLNYKFPFYKSKRDQLVTYDDTFITSPAIAFVKRATLKELKLLIRKKNLTIVGDVEIPMDSSDMRDYINRMIKELKKREVEE